MKKCFLDSNFLVYLKDSLSLHHQAAAKKLSNLISANASLYISPLILDEFLYIFQKAIIIEKLAAPYRQLQRAVEEILQIPSLSIVNPPAAASKQMQVISYMEKYNLKPRDAYHLITIISNGIDSFATFDEDYKKVFAARILKKI
ncbi:type II toxin-antitoxin system VapC family toxin [Candidatus Gottesmanbacteria bacterium]|nr:type II toxin-antitoxin system VapC family toxin [Candidatus Gottesmanbacteria bacterium]